MAQDAILEAVERKRRKTTLGLFLHSPTKAIQSKPYIVYIISIGLSAIFSVIALMIFHADLSQVLVFALVLALIPPGLYDFQRRSIIRRNEAEFPALLRDISLSVRAGMTLKGALSVTAQGEYGTLSPAVKHLDSMMSWGVSFEEALLFLAQKYPTPLIKRTISTIIEASKTGGEIGPIMESVANDAEEIKSLERRRKADTQPYLAVCYMSYFVFLAVIIILSHYFIGMMADIVQETGVESVGGGGMQFRVSEQDIKTYSTLFFHASIIQGIFSGVVTGKIAEGTILAGLKHSLIFVILGLIAYQFLA